jgi:hypothetical protein
MEPGKTETQTLTAVNNGQGPLTVNGIKVGDEDAVSCKLDFKGSGATPFTMQEKDQFTLACTLTMPKDKPYYHSRVELNVEGKNAKPIPIYIAARSKDSKTVVKKVGDTEAALSAVMTNVKKVQKVQKKDKGE